MMGGHIQISVETSGQGQLEQLVAFLAEAGFEGFQEDNDRLLAFIPEDRYDENEVERILSAFSLRPEIARLPAQNWNQSWEKNFEPVIVDEFCAVRAPFHAAIREARFEILITPKMSFGTGHHPTTYMMMQAMEKFDFAGKDVLDFGTGTGLLAILAEKCGARRVTGIDSDDWSVINAAENLMANGCRVVTLEKADHLEGKGSFDLILANVNKTVIFNNLKEFRQHLTPAGVLVVSGMLQEDAPDLLATAEAKGLRLAAMMSRGQWICASFEEKEDGME